MILLDTNVLLYSTGNAHPLRDPCRRILQAVGESRLPACVTDVVIAEFIHARARQSSRTEAAGLTAELIAIVDTVVPASPGIRTRALRLYAATERLSVNDAVIAATAIERDFVLVSADGDFGEARGLQWLHPDSDRARELVKS